MNWNKFLPCILLTTVLGACSGKGEQTNVEPAAVREMCWQSSAVEKWQIMKSN